MPLYMYLYVPIRCIHYTQFMDSVLVCVPLVQTQWRQKLRMILLLCVLIRVSSLHTTGVYMYMYVINTGTGKMGVSRDDDETDRGDANASGSGRDPLLSQPLLQPLKRRKFSPTSAAIMLYMYV